MRDFRKFIEAFKFSDDRSKLQNHPLVQGTTFGVEIEFQTGAVPFDDMKPEWLAIALKRTPFEEDYIAAYSHNEPDYEANEFDFTNYIRTNKKMAWDVLWEVIEERGFNADHEDSEYLEVITGYWGKKLIEIVKAAGFRIQVGQQAYGNIWAVGSDGHDNEYNLPVVEVRTGIMKAQELDKLYTVLQGMSSLSKQYPREFRAAGNTGLHIHVHNSSVGKDMFSRLAAASNTDEDSIWDVSAPHDRDFQRYAMLNKPQDFESRVRGGLHDMIILALQAISKRQTLDDNVQSSFIVSNQELDKRLRTTLHRNNGVNVITEHPTVEYRYLSSMMVVEKPAKVIEFIRYFIDHTAQMGNRSQIKFESGDIHAVLTRMPRNMVRIDFQSKKAAEIGRHTHNKPPSKWEDKEGRVFYQYPKIPKPSHPVSDIVNPSSERGDQPFSQWFKSLTPQQQSLERLKVSRKN